MTIVTGRDPASGRSLRLRLEGERIAAIDPGPPGERAWIAPGLIDIQTNGYAGYDLNATGLTPEIVAAFVRAVRREGVTTVLPTLITAPPGAFLTALAAIATAREAEPAIRHAIAGIHVEGPHISPEEGARGAHPLASIRPPDLGEFEAWQRACGGLVRIVTLSPHWPGAPDYIRVLAARGVHVAIGHTHAGPEAITAAVAAGATLSTHLGNGVAATLPRHPNLIWAQLAEDRLSASFIADGHHLPDDTLRAMLRAKESRRAILVSDTAALGGMPPGLYDQPIGGRVELTPGGRLGIVDTPYLAGAALPLRHGVARVAALGFGLSAAVAMATRNPGRLLGGRGQLAIGACADLLRFAWAPGDGAIRPLDILTRGQPV
ncbi:amidohydrolase family protein [Methylobacterium terricola]|uniref:Amidohydrolase family protein n=1 Tax=Methylobacterium terricola TaxID=2583531 RepID=A0A5C4L627_9HYPH|nr:amidohydrolase family protein [Methylobacterium terricola]TNC05946.1 amidohydrolase family protein [Methylobacterium terricola]